MKKCKVCNNIKGINGFYKDRGSVDGRQSKCKDCKRKTRDLIKANINAKKWKNNNTKHVKQYHKKYSIDNSKLLAAKSKAYDKTNAKQVKIKNAAWYKNNVECSKLKSKLWRRSNPDKCNTYSAKYRAKKINQMPHMTQAELELIKDIYKKCQELSKSTGTPHEVDHIIPLSKGGPHHPDNLQILTASENKSWGNKNKKQ